MGKIKKFILAFLVTFVVLAFILYKVVFPSWYYVLPNSYRVWKKSNQNVVLGVEIDGDFVTKDVGVEEYVAEFQYNDSFVGVKSLVIDEEDNVSVLFYLVDTLEKEVHGPYMDEETYLAVVGVWSSDSLGEWITTTEVPVGAKFR